MNVIFYLSYGIKNTSGVKTSYFCHFVPNIVIEVYFKYFKPNFVCLLTNERYKTYQTGFSISRLGHAPGVGLWGYRGVGGHFFSKFNQSWCVSDSHEWHMQLHNCFGPHPPPGEGPKGQISLTFN